jgi:hypothetical protein
MEFFRAIDRCTTKSFAMLDTMPGRRPDGHVPGGNHTDTVCNPTCNIVFLDAARVHESVIAHELGHAWVQYVHGCEDLRTMEDAGDPQRMRLVGFIQSYVLDLKVNDLLRRKGFDMNPINEDRNASLRQLAQALRRGYSPKHLREEVFMALLVADKMVEADSGNSHELACIDRSLEVIRDAGAPLARLAKRFAESAGRHGYDSHAAILATIDECLISAFEHCGDRIDLDTELVVVNPEEPDTDKFPARLPELKPRTKTVVGRYMAQNDITSDWPQCLKPSITGRARVHFRSPGGETSRQVSLNERMGPPNRYSDLPEEIAEQLAMKHLNQTGRYHLHGGPPFRTADLNPLPDPAPRLRPPFAPAASSQAGPQVPPAPARAWPHRPYMAGYGRFLTQAALEMQLTGERPYAYCENNPTTYVDPEGLQPKKPRHRRKPHHHKKPPAWDSAPCKAAHDCILKALETCFNPSDAKTLATIMQCVAFGESTDEKGPCDPANVSDAVNGKAYGLFQLGDKEIARCFPSDCADNYYARSQMGDKCKAAVKEILWLNDTFGGGSVGSVLGRYWGCLDCPGVHPREGHQTSDCLHAKGIDPNKIPMPNPKPGCDPCK